MLNITRLREIRKKLKASFNKKMEVLRDKNIPLEVVREEEFSTNKKFKIDQRRRKSSNHYHADSTKYQRFY